MCGARIEGRTYARARVHTDQDDLWLRQPVRLDLLLRHPLRRLAAALRVALRFRGGLRRVNLPTYLSLRYALHVLCVLVRGRMRAPVIREAVRPVGVVVPLLCSLRSGCVCCGFRR